MTNGENPYEAPRTTEFSRDESGERLSAAYGVDSRLLYRTYSFYAWQTTVMRYIIFPVTSVALVALLLLLLADAPRSYLIGCAVFFCIMHLVQMIVPHVQVKWLIRDVRRQTALSWLGPYFVHVTRNRLTVTQGERSFDVALADVQDYQFTGDLLLVVLEKGVVLPIPESGDFGGDTFLSFCDEFARRLTEAEKT